MNRKVSLEDMKLFVEEKTESCYGFESGIGEWYKYGIVMSMWKIVFDVRRYERYFPRECE